MLPYFHKIYKLNKLPYIRNIYKCPFIFFQFTFVCLIYVFLFSPSLTTFMHHTLGLYILDTSVEAPYKISLVYSSDNLLYLSSNEKATTE